jgi:RNA polymerase sigma-70 factor (ECF subfamily)
MDRVNMTTGPLVPDSTELLLQRCRKGDRQAFDALLNDHQSYAYALACRLMQDADEAQDVVQESFIRVWKHLPRFDGRVRFTTWLYQIVTRLCLDRLKARRRRLNIFARDGHEAGHCPEQEYDQKDIQEQILAAAATLPIKQQLVFTLRDLQDLSIAEVQTIAGMSNGAVKTNLYLARRAIRAKILKLL